MIGVSQPARLSPLAYAWAAIFAVALGTALRAWLLQSQVDFGAFYSAAERWLAAEPLYRLDERVPYKYAPIAAVFFTPFTLVPYAVARAIWLTLSAVALIAFARWSVVRTSAAGSLPPPPAVARRTALVLALCLPLADYLFRVGQCDAVLAAAMAVSLSVAPRSPILSGVLWGVVCSFKLPFLAFVAPALLRREGRRLFGLAAALGIAVIAPALQYGVPGALELLAWWRGLLAETTPPLLCSWDNQGVYGISCSAGLPQAGFFAAAGVAGAALGWAFYVRLRSTREGDPLLDAVSFVVVALCSPLGWRSSFVVAIPLLAFALNRSARWALAPWAFVAVSLTLTYELFGADRFIAWMRLRPLGIAALFTLGAALFGAHRTLSAERDRRQRAGGNT